MFVLAHRGHREQPTAARDLENEVEYLLEAVRDGFGLEFDIRLDRQGACVLAHDPTDWSHGRSADRLFAELAEMAPGPPVPHFAINIKDIGGGLFMLNALEQYPRLRRRAFMFDFELALDHPLRGQLMGALEAAGITCAVRASETEPLAEALKSRADVYWLDEWTVEWVDRVAVSSVQQAGALAFVVSPELHRPDLPIEAVSQAWSRFADAGADGICTDYATACRAHLAARARGVSPDD